MFIKQIKKICELGNSANVAAQTKCPGEYGLHITALDVTVSVKKGRRIA
jgi:hypothetical protein